MRNTGLLGANPRLSQSDRESTGGWMPPSEIDDVHDAARA